MIKCVNSRLDPHLQTMMKNLMRSRGCGMLLFSSATPERCSVLPHSWVLRNTRTSLGSKGTSELHSSSLGDLEGGREENVGRRVEGRQSQRGKGHCNKDCVCTQYKQCQKWYLYRGSKFIPLQGTETGGSSWLCSLCKNI